MALSYYGSKLSNHITKLDNGCIVCHSVPIARTGVYKYLKNEIGLDGTGIVDVYREPDEVFSDKAIASFNGKAFTDTHPNVDVTSDNWAMFSKGEVTNVRRGTGEHSDKLIADILVRDPIVINEILSGAKREISSGYTCEYVEEDGKIYQKNIRGNHVALVQAGRAGSEVKIYDEKPNNMNLSKYHIIKNLNKAIKIL